MTDPSPTTPGRTRLLKLAVIMLCLAGTGVMVYVNRDHWSAVLSQPAPVSQSAAHQWIDRPPRAPYPDQPVVAITNFSTDRDSFPREHGALQLTEALRAQMPTDRPWRWVERAELARVVDELALSMATSSGGADALRVGDWLGCHLIVTGEFVDTGGREQRLVLSVVEALTADVVASRELPVPEDLAGSDQWTAHRLAELAGQVDALLAEAHQKLVDHRGDAVVMLMYITNRTGDPRLNPLRSQLTRLLAAEAGRGKGVRLVQISRPESASQEQSLSLMGLTDRPGEAWQVSADRYLWGTLSTTDEALAQAIPFDQRVFELMLSCWDGAEATREYPLRGTLEQILAGLPALCRRVWADADKPSEPRLNLTVRDRVARTLRTSAGGYSYNSREDGPDSPAAQAVIASRQMQVASAFFAPDTLTVDVGFMPLPHREDQQWLATRQHTTDLYRQALKELSGRSPTSEVRNLLEAMAELRQALWSDNAWTRDMPRAERLRFQDGLLRMLRELGVGCSEHLDQSGRESLRFMGVRDLYDVLLTEPTSSPELTLSVWNAWWPVIGPGVLQQVHDRTDRRLFLPSHEASIRRQYALAGRPDEFDRLVSRAAEDRDAGLAGVVRVERDIDAARYWIARTRQLSPLDAARDHQTAALPPPPRANPSLRDVGAPWVRPRGVQVPLPSERYEAALRVAVRDTRQSPFVGDDVYAHRIEQAGSGVLLTRPQSLPYGQSAPSRRDLPRWLPDEALRLVPVPQPPDTRGAIFDALIVGDHVWYSVADRGLYRHDLRTGAWESAGIEQGLVSEDVTGLVRYDDRVIATSRNQVAVSLPIDRPLGEGILDLRVGQVDRPGEVVNDRVLVYADGHWRWFDLRRGVSGQLPEVGAHTAALGEEVAWGLRRDALLRFDLRAGDAAPPTEYAFDLHHADVLCVDGPYVWVGGGQPLREGEVTPSGLVTRSIVASHIDSERVSWVGLWDTVGERWLGQFELHGDLQRIVTTPRKLVLIVPDAMHEVVIYDRPALLASMGVLAAAPDASPNEAALGFETTAAMHDAFMGNLAGLRRRFDERLSLREAAIDGWNLLLSAVWGGDADTVAYLLQQGASPDAATRGSAGVTALTLAVAMDRADLVDLLLQHGADIDHAAGLWGSPLTTAIAHDRREMMRRLIERGASVDAPVAVEQPFSLMYDDKRNLRVACPLVVAIARRDTAAIELLLDAGASASALNDTQWSEPPLYFAVRSGDLDAARRMLRAGADADQRVPGRFGHVLDLLHQQTDSADFGRELLARGADPLASPTFVFHFLQSEDLSNADVDALIEAGVDFDHVRHWRSIQDSWLMYEPGDTATLLHALVTNPAPFHRVLQRGRVDLDQSAAGHRLGDLIASFCARKGDLGLAADLVEMGYSIDVPDENTDRRTALLDAATYTGREDRLRILLLLGADVMKTDVNGKGAVDLVRDDVRKAYLAGENLLPPAEAQVSERTE